MGKNIKRTMKYLLKDRQTVNLKITVKRRKAIIKDGKYLVEFLASLYTFHIFLMDCEEDMTGDINKKLLW